MSPCDSLLFDERVFGEIALKVGDRFLTIVLILEVITVRSLHLSDQSPQCPG